VHSRRRVFVTGGTGHFDSYIIPELIAAWPEVTSLGPVGHGRGGAVGARRSARRRVAATSRTRRAQGDGRGLRRRDPRRVEAPAGSCPAPALVFQPGRVNQTGTTFPPATGFGPWGSTDLAGRGPPSGGPPPGLGVSSDSGHARTHDIKILKLLLRCASLGGAMSAAWSRGLGGSGQCHARTHDITQTGTTFPPATGFGPWGSTDLAGRGPPSGGPPPVVGGSDGQCHARTHDIQNLTLLFKTASL
jgi:hypothetical protein